MNTRSFLYRVDTSLFVCFGNHIRLLLVDERTIVIQFVEFRVMVAVLVVIVDALLLNDIVQVDQFMLGVMSLRQEHPVRVSKNVVFDVEEEGLYFVIVEHADNRDTYEEPHKSIHLHYMYKKMDSSDLF